ncbi:rele/stbe replicon stabilization toxin [hydrocarbon metagenome]|uniref:Rele/stbe replicon stabilization toxin n=1 Tax=hydrocarbon metagenome TaxID=938273 RepID=A0A0W8G247_9ZZZZ
MRRLERAISLTKDANDSIKSLDAKQYRQVVQRIFDLSDNPKPHDSKALKGKTEKEQKLLRVDAGEFRIIYRHDASTVEILVVGRRNDGKVYKNLGDKDFSS